MNSSTRVVKLNLVIIKLNIFINYIKIFPDYLVGKKNKKYKKSQRCVWIILIMKSKNITLLLDKSLVSQTIYRLFYYINI